MRINNTVEDIEKVHTTTNFGQNSSDYNSKNTYEGEKNLFERQPKESGSTTLMLSIGFFSLTHQDKLWPLETFP